MKPIDWTKPLISLRRKEAKVTYIGPDGPGFVVRVDYNSASAGGGTYYARYDTYGQNFSATPQEVIANAPRIKEQYAMWYTAIHDSDGKGYVASFDTKKELDDEIARRVHHAAKDGFKVFATTKYVLTEGEGL